MNTYAQNQLETLPFENPCAFSYRDATHLKMDSLVSTIVHVCSWCKKVKWTDATWLEPQEAASRFSGLAGDIPFRQSHGICSQCIAEAVEGWVNSPSKD